MKAILHRLHVLVGRLRKYVSGIVLTGAIAGVAAVSIGLGSRLSIGSRRKQDADVLQTIEQAEASRHLPEMQRAVRALDKLRRGRMQPATRARLLVALGKMHCQCARLGTDPAERRDHLTGASRCYGQAAELSREPNIVADVQEGRAHVHYLHQNWNMAEAGFGRILNRELPPGKRGTVEVLQCKCLIELGRPDEAYAILRRTLQRYTAGATHDQAKLLLAEMLAAERKRREGTPAAEQLPEDGPIAMLGTAELTDQARTMLTTMLARLSPGDERRLRVLNGLLELCIVTGDVDKAYGYVRELEGVIGHRDQQVRSFDLLATLEEKQGNLAAAEDAMRFSIRKFPDHERSNDMRLRLSRLLLAQSRLREGLAMFESVTQHAKGDAWAERITHELLPNHGTSITDRLTKEGSEPWGGETLRRLVRTLQEEANPRHLLVQERLLYLRALLAYRAADCTTAETEIATYLNTAPCGDFRGEILAMDADCAVAMRRSPAIRATRAHRYLAPFPEGEHGEAMLAVLLRAYFEMQLYRDNLEMAEAAFVRAMVQATDDAEQRLRLPILRATRWIAQCNSRLKRTAAASTLFQRLSRRMRAVQPDLDFYRDWAATAWDSEQRRESIRRFEVGSSRLPPGRGREQLRTMALHARFLTGEPGAIPAVEARLEELDRRGFPADEAVLRPLFEVLLQHALDTEPSAMPELLARVQAKMPNADWDSAWALRHLQKALANDQAKEARAELGKIYIPAKSKPGRRTRIRSCLQSLETLAELEEQADELRERGL